MPRRTTDSLVTWTLDRNNQTWTLTEGTFIDAATSTTGVDNVANGSNIRILGKVIADSYGVSMGSKSASLFIGDLASVSARSIGVSMDPDGGTVLNHGTIAAGDCGVDGANGVIENFGSIVGELGIAISEGEFVIRNAGRMTGTLNAINASGTGKISNMDDGVLSGDTYGILLGGTQHTTSVSNEGLIIGGGAAIYSEGQLNLRNTGTIIGDIQLSAADDRIDTRGGVVRGVIYGGGGDDLYLISNPKVRIVDNGASFGDLVRSTATYTLTGGLENLVLLGKKDIDGTGNAANNFVLGNAGDNALSGAAGNDILAGGAGIDRLTGGEGADSFAFRRSFDRDRVADFTDGEDAITTGLVKTQAQFDRLDIRQAGDDVVIDFGQGDRLILADFNRDDLTYADFASF